MKQSVSAEAEGVPAAGSVRLLWLQWPWLDPEGLHVWSTQPWNDHVALYSQTELIYWVDGCVQRTGLLLNTTVVVLWLIFFFFARQGAQNKEQLHWM